MNLLFLYTIKFLFIPATYFESYVQKFGNGKLTEIRGFVLDYIEEFIKSVMDSEGV